MSISCHKSFLIGLDHRPTRFAGSFADARRFIMSAISSSPTALTPDEERLDSFEFPSTSSESQSPKKARRQMAFYPNVSSSNKLQKPFSRSAAKRESVMALGSIEHLQHYFTKTGIVAKQNTLKQTKGLVPAIGGPANHLQKPSLGSIQEFHLPPSPAVPVFTRLPYPTIEKTYEVDPENLKPGVIRDLEAVSESWGLTKGAEDIKPVEGFDVLSTLKLTTQLIRSVRNYMVSLPDDSVSSQIDKQHFRPSTLQPVPMKRIVSNPNATSDPLSRIRRSALDVLTVLRALEESSRLPLSDDAYDAQSDHMSSQDSRSPEPIHAVLDGDEHEQRSAPQGHDVSFAISVVSIPGRSEAVPVWDDEDDEFESPDDNGGKREVWDDRLVLGGGWLYRQDIRLADLKTERGVVGNYLDAVDGGLFNGPGANGSRGWESVAAERVRAEESRAKGRRTSLGKHRDDKSPDRGDKVTSTGLFEAMNNMTITEETDPPDQSEGEDSVDEDSLPGWAKRATPAEGPLARAHTLLVALLPASLLPLLPISYTERIELLSALSSGQLLCAAYNVGVRRSRKPWGYINKDSIHDIAALESKVMMDDIDKDEAEKRNTGWTFRRTDNLRLWAAALKLRYLVPLTTPMPPLPSLPSLQSASPSNDSLANASKSTTPSGSPAPARTKFIAGTGEVPLIVFDAKAVARRDEGWDEMLETVVLLWVAAVVEERRGAR
ncbi:hypothetical protein M0805_002956 [Coniferiporia weirii]|nr:hypothetical protein M0805_002956 [Coniferiporia weirii]